MKPDGDTFLANVMDLLADAICVVDAQGVFMFVSAACRQIFGYEPEEMVGRNMIDFVLPEDRARTLGQVDAIHASTQQPHFENRYLRKDGQVVHIMWSARWSESGRVRVAVARDVTERKRAESMQAALYAVSEAAHTAEDLVTLFRRIHEIVATLTTAANFFVALYDEGKDELSFPYYADSHHTPPEPRPLDSGTLSAEVIRTGQALLLRADSPDPLPPGVKIDMGKDSLDWLGVPLQTQKGPIGVLVVQSYFGDTRYTEKDVELLQFVSAQVASAIERKQAETWLRHIARHDPLTDLPNRSLLNDRLQAALQQSGTELTRLAVLYLDLDMFKEVNDRHGHAAGDQLLQETAQRLRRCVGDAGMVGRIGGDEFLVLLDQDPSPARAVELAEQIRVALCEPFSMNDDQFQVSPSIGIALHPQHGDDYKRLIRHADEAMYAAKKAGGNRCRVKSSPRR